MRETSTRYDHPYRPVPVAALNGMGALLPKPKLSVDALMRTARRRTGLDEFGDEAFREPLAQLVQSLDDEAALTWVGRFITRERLVGILETRLRLEAFEAAHPEVHDEEIVAPIFIVGLQRTGTTKLQRLLAADPSVRALRAWEALNPVPFAKGDPEVRIAKARTAERALRYLAPDFFAIHPVEANAPEEDVLLLDTSFLSTVSEASYHVPTFARWLEGRDQTPAYRDMKRLLRILQFKRGGERWVLKTPHHLEWLDTLLEIFPDAKLIQTHRDPASTLPSFASMIAHGRGVFSDDVDPREVAEHWLRKIQRLLAKSLAVRENLDDGRVLDVSYAQLMEDPLPTLEAIYRFTDRQLTAQGREALQSALQDNPQYKYGRHVYQAQSFGLTPQRIEATFGDYRTRFNIPRE